MVSHKSLNDNKYPHVFRTLLSILTDLHKAVIIIIIIIIIIYTFRVFHISVS